VVAFTTRHTKKQLCPFCYLLCIKAEMSPSRSIYVGKESCNYEIEFTLISVRINGLSVKRSESDKYFIVQWFGCGITKSPKVVGLNVLVLDLDQLPAKSFGDLAGDLGSLDSQLSTPFPAC